MVGDHLTTGFRPWLPTDGTFGAKKKGTASKGIKGTNHPDRQSRPISPLSMDFKIPDAEGHGEGLG